MNKHITEETNWPIKILNISGGKCGQRNNNEINKIILNVLSLEYFSKHLF